MIIQFIDALNAGGTTAMFDGLMNALREIVTNGMNISHTCIIFIVHNLRHYTDSNNTEPFGVVDLIFILHASV